MIELQMRDLSRAQRDKIRAGETAELAEEIVAEVFDLLHRPNEAEWYDCRHPHTDAKTEVKSTIAEIGDAHEAAGRFRLRLDQLRSLLSSDAAGVAWIVFVLFDYDAGVVKLRRVKPSTVSAMVRDRGGWNDAGHQEFDKQHKLPIGEVF